jgi:hypothetical protein
MAKERSPGAVSLAAALDVGADEVLGVGLEDAVDLVSRSSRNSSLSASPCFAGGFDLFGLGGPLLRCCFFFCSRSGMS